jgi:polygalacturonase
MIFLYLLFLFIPYSMGQDNQPAILVFNVMQYGAVGDGKTLDTDAIQKATDEAARIGNGAQVLVPAGRQYLIGTLVFICREMLNY